MTHRLREAARGVEGPMWIYEGALSFVTFIVAPIYVGIFPINENGEGEWQNALVQAGRRSSSGVAKPPIPAPAGPTAVAQRRKSSVGAPVPRRRLRIFAP